MRRIGVVTSGGDAPGMNAALRAVVRAGIYHGLEVLGIRRGFMGLVNGAVVEMGLESVSGIINLGGTILHSVRCEEFKTKEGQAQAAEVIKSNKIDGLVVIGGDGSFHGARELSIGWGIYTVAVPATIDNDVAGTDYSIGFDTAVNTALEAIDKIRDTAVSHERLFIIEVMGKEKGFIALEVGLAAGAEVIVIPEVKFDIAEICDTLRKGRERGKSSSIIVVAEGAVGAHELGRQIQAYEDGWEVRVSVLGHLQRGGPPTAFSRILACRLGAAAVEVLWGGGHTKMVGVVGNQVKVSDIDEARKYEKQVDLSLYELARQLAI